MVVNVMHYTMDHQQNRHRYNNLNGNDDKYGHILGCDLE